MAKSKASSQIAEQLEIELPDKKYFTIGEVADLAEVKSHVLRYWEQVFPQLEPSKRRGRRYYQKKDVLLVMEIKKLVHNEGFTIPGAKAQLSKKHIDVDDMAIDSEQKTVIDDLKTVQSEIKEFRNYIQSRYK